MAAAICFPGGRNKALGRINVLVETEEIEWVILPLEAEQPVIIISVSGPHPVGSLIIT